MGPERLIRTASLFAATAVMLRREAVPRYGFDERISYVSDWKIQVDCLAGGGVYGYVDGILAQYRFHPGGVTSSRKVACYEDSIRCLHVIARQYPEYRNETRVKEGEYNLLLTYHFLGRMNFRGSFRSGIRAVWLTRLYRLPAVIGNVMRLRRQR